MKTIKHIILAALVLVFTYGTCVAQDDVYYNPDKEQTKEKREKLNKRKINTGYVFIDGKYVEPPYRVRRKGKSIYVNDCQIAEYNILKTEKRIVYKTHPGLPPNINKMDSIDAVMNACIEGTDIKYSTAIKSYLYTNYSYEASVDSLRKYIASFPNIKSVSGDGLLDVVAHNGHRRKIIISSSPFRKSYEAYNSKERNLNQRGTLRKGLNQMVAEFEYQLKQGDIFFIFYDTLQCSKYRKLIYGHKQGLRIIDKLCNICYNDSVTKENQIELINKEIKGNVFQKYTSILIDNFNYVKNTYNDYGAINNIIIDKYSEQNSEKHKAPTTKKSNVSISPSNININFGFPDPWSNRYTLQFTAANRISQIVNLVKKQGYNIIYNEYIDETNGVLAPQTIRQDYS